MPINPVRPGDVITAAQFNQMAQAINDLSSGSSAGSTTVISFSLRFNPFLRGAAKDPEWIVAIGEVIPTVVGQLASANGWMQVQLPDGANLQTLTVIGQKASASKPVDFSVTLSRRAVNASGTGRVLTTVNLTDVFADNAAFTESTAITTSIDKGAIVDNKSYMYLLQSELVEAPSSPPIKLYTVQIGYLLGATSQQ